MNMKIIPVSLLFLSLISFTPAFAAEPDETKASMIHTADLFSRIIEKAKPAVVYIQVKKETGGKESSYINPAN